MCQATVYLRDQVIMRDVMSVELVPDGVRLTTLFEPPRIVSAAIREIDLIGHRVLLEPAAESSLGHHPRPRRKRNQETPRAARGSKLAGDARVGCAEDPGTPGPSKGRWPE